ncbi:hypothetical protein BDR22DRAFT_238583 [Usnea florida]
MEQSSAIENKVTTAFSDDPPLATLFTEASMRKDEHVRNAMYDQSKADLLTELEHIKAIVDVLLKAFQDTIRIQVNLLRTREEWATFSKRASAKSMVDSQIFPSAAATNSLPAEGLRRLRRSKATAQLRQPPSEHIPLVIRTADHPDSFEMRMLRS